MNRDGFNGFDGKTEATFGSTLFSVFSLIDFLTVNVFDFITVNVFHFLTVNVFDFLAFVDFLALKNKYSAIFPTVSS